MKNILFILLSFCLAGEMEVDGDLKVTGTVDANGNPITNVGAALSMTDAINGNVLQDALRDDTNYEYKVFLTRVQQRTESNEIGYYEYQVGVNAGNQESEWSVNFHNVLIPLLTDGWKIDNIIQTTNPTGDANFQKNLYILKRPLEEN